MSLQFIYRRFISFIHHVDADHVLFIRHRWSHIQRKCRPIIFTHFIRGKLFLFFLFFFLFTFDSCLRSIQIKAAYHIFLFFLLLFCTNLIHFSFVYYKLIIIHWLTVTNSPVSYIKNLIYKNMHLSLDFIRHLCLRHTTHSLILNFSSDTFVSLPLSRFQKNGKKKLFFFLFDVCFQFPAEIIEWL